MEKEKLIQEIIIRLRKMSIMRLQYLLQIIDEAEIKKSKED